jgi:hypothetical protein
VRLQDEHCRVLIDHRGALFATDVRFDQLPLDGGGRQALIPKCDRQVGELAKVARESSRRLRAGAFASIHIDGETQHESDCRALGGERQ